MTICKHVLNQAAGLLTLTIMVLASTFANAVEIQTVTSDKGVKALLVEDYTVPLIALQFSFKGGATQDAEGKEGTAQLLTTLLDEGAGDMDSETIQAKLDDVGLSYSFNAGRDGFSGGMKTLVSEKDEAFSTFALMLNEPRFDADPVKRMKNAALSRLKRNKQNPQALAGKALRESVFGSHPYGRSSRGTIESVESLGADDVRDYHRRVFARDNLVVGVVGAISKDELKTVLDAIFGDLPEKAALSPMPDIAPKTGDNVHVDLGVPQTTIALSLPGIKRDDPDFFTAYLVNYVLGGGSFSSRLYTEIREKRGLAYGAYSYLGTYDSSATIGAGTATSAERANQTVDILFAEIKRMAEEGPTEEELEKAKKYIIGSYAVQNLDTSDKIASVLVAIQEADLGLDYIDRRASLIEKVTIEDAKRVARELFSGKATLVTVGAPLKK